jgi:hypothetical protein
MWDELLLQSKADAAPLGFRSSNAHYQEALIQYAFFAINAEKIVMTMIRKHVHGRTEGSVLISENGELPGAHRFLDTE